MTTARFDRLGETTVRDEYYERSDGGWQMVKYEYDFLDMKRSSRLAFHLHPVAEPAPTAHAHCEPKLSAPDHEHYRYSS